MKTLKHSKPAKKSLSTQSLNPKKLNPKKAPCVEPTPTLRLETPDSLWQAYLETREGTFASHLQTLSIQTLRRYALHGCHRANLILENFGRFVSLCQIQIGSRA